MKFELSGKEKREFLAKTRGLADVQGENHYVALGRTVQQLGSFLLKFCDLTDKEREDIQYTLEQLDRDQNRKY